jgi:hypothetical protein
MTHRDTLETLNEQIEILQQIVDTQKGTIEAQERTINNFEKMRDLNDKIYQQQSDAWFGVFDTLSHVGIGDFSEKQPQGIDDFNYSLVSECAGIAWSKHSKLENLMANLKGKPNVY